MNVALGELFQKALPEAQRTQGIESDRINLKVVSLGFKFGHQVVSCTSSNFGHQVALLALVVNYLH